MLRKQKTNIASSELRNLFPGAGHGHVEVGGDVPRAVSRSEELRHPIAVAKRPRAAHDPLQKLA